MKRFFILSAILACCALPLRISGAEVRNTKAYCAPAVEVHSSDGDSLIYQLQSIEVIATRPSAKTTGSIAEISGEQLSKDNTGTDLPGLLQFLPSVIYTSESGMGTGASSLRIRGADATRIDVNLNGMSLNDPDSHAMYWYDTPDLAAGTGQLNIARGALDIASAALKEDFCADASFSYGSFNTNREAVHAGTGLMKDRWIADLRFSHIGTDGYIDRASSNMHSYMVQCGYYNGGTMLKALSFGGKTKSYLTYEGVSEEDMALYGRRYHTSGQYKCENGEFVLADGTRVAYFNDQTDNYLQTNNQLIIDTRISTALSLNAMLYYTYGKGYYRQYKYDAWLCSYDNLASAYERADLIRRKNMENHRAGAQVNVLWHNDSFEVAAGGNYMFYTCPHHGSIDWIDGHDASIYEGFRWYGNDVFKHDANVYGKTAWSPLADLDVHAELKCRYVNYSTHGTNDNYDWERGTMQKVNVDAGWLFLNPELGIRWTIDGNNRVTGSLSISNREPTRSDFTDRYQFSVLSDNPRPEMLLNFETGFRHNGESLNAGINFYYMKYKDQLVPTGIMNDSGDNLNVNVSDSYRRGVELDAGVKLWKVLTLSANCTLSRNRFRTEDDGVLHELTYSPSVLVNACAAFTKGAFEARLRGQYVGRQSISYDSEWKLDPYAFANFDAAYTLPWHPAGITFRIGVKVNNLTDSKYCSYGYPGYFFPQAGINASGTLGISFN